MFIAHLPAGYLLTRQVEAGWRMSGLLPVGLAASVLPDVDLLWFYVVDHRRVLHHYYWTHVPFWWAVIAATWCVGYAGMHRRRPAAGSAVFFGNVFLHLVLDTIVGGVAWLAPFSRQLYSLVTVPVGHRWWVWNFVLHWTFALELLLVVWAIISVCQRSGDLQCEATSRGSVFTKPLSSFPTSSLLPDPRSVYGPEECQPRREEHRRTNILHAGRLIDTSATERPRTRP